MIDVHALSRFAFSRRAPQGRSGRELTWPGDPGHLGGLTNEEIDFLLDKTDLRDTARPARAA